MVTLTLSPWEVLPFSATAKVLAGTVTLYKLWVFARKPGNGRRCRYDQATSVDAFSAGKWQAAQYLSLTELATYLAQLHVALDALEAFFQAAAAMGWEEELLLEARCAANALIAAPESPTYLVIRLEGGVIVSHAHAPLAEAQMAVASHCDVDTTELHSTAGIPWGAVFSAADASGDRDAWAFPAHDSGANLADLSARVDTLSEHRWQVWDAFVTAAARLRSHGLEGPGVELLPGTGCPYCGSQRAVGAAHEPGLAVCQDCGRAWEDACPECQSSDITFTWGLDRSPTGYVRGQILTWHCGCCENVWNDTEEVEVPA